MLEYTLIEYLYIYIYTHMHVYIQNTIYIYINKRYTHIYIYILYLFVHEYKIHLYISSFSTRTSNTISHEYLECHVSPSTRKQQRQETMLPLIPPCMEVASNLQATWSLRVLRRLWGREGCGVGVFFKLFVETSFRFEARVKRIHQS